MNDIIIIIISIFVKRHEVVISDLYRYSTVVTDQQLMTSCKCICGLVLTKWRSLYVIQPSSAQSPQEDVTVRIRTATYSATHLNITSLHHYVTPFTAVRYHRHLQWLWLQHAVSGIADCLTLFQHPETVTHYTVLSVAVCPSVSCRGEMTYNVSSGALNSTHSLTLETLRWLAFHRLNWTACRWSWMQRLELSFRQVAMIISLRYSDACTGFVCLIAYFSSLPSWYISACVDFDWPIWPTPFSRSPGFLVDNACGHRRRRYWMSRLRNCPLSATERFPSPRHEHGRVCQLKWRHSLQNFKIKLKSHLFLASFP